MTMFEESKHERIDIDSRGRHGHIWGGPPGPECIYKKLCIHPCMFKLQSPPKYSPFDAIHLSRSFLHRSKQFLNSILMPFSASAVFCFTSSISAKHFHLRTFLIQGNKKRKSVRDRSDEQGGWGMGHAIFGQNLLNTQCSAGRCAHKSPVMKWANVLKESSKKIHWSWM